MKTVNHVVLEEKILKTRKGSIIKRSKYGVGKLIGGILYFHKDYINILPKDLYSDSLNVLYKDYPVFYFNIIKWDIKNNVLTFVNSSEFDNIDEPESGEYVTIKGNVSIRGKTDKIWHHKWLWVKDDYKGFDVDKAYKRSKKWLQMPNIQFSKIGDKKYWEKYYIPSI